MLSNTYKIVIRILVSGAALFFLITHSLQLTLILLGLLTFCLTIFLFHQQILAGLKVVAYAFGYPRNLFDRIDQKIGLAQTALQSCRREARYLNQHIQDLNQQMKGIGEISQATYAYIKKIQLKLSVRRDLQLSRARELQKGIQTLRRQCKEIKLQRHARRLNEQSRTGDDSYTFVDHLLTDLQGFIDYDIETRICQTADDSYPYDEFVDLKYATEDLRRLTRRNTANTLPQAPAGANGAPAHEDEDDLLYEQIEFNLKKLEVLERW